MSLRKGERMINQWCFGKATYYACADFQDAKFASRLSLNPRLDLSFMS